MIRLLCLGALAIGSASLAAADTGPVAPAARAKSATATARPAPGDLDKPICKSVAMTASRLGGKRMCMSKPQWDEQSRAARENVENLPTRGGQTSMMDAPMGHVP